MWIHQIPAVCLLGPLRLLLSLQPPSTRATSSPHERCPRAAAPLCWLGPLRFAEEERGARQYPCTAQHSVKGPCSCASLGLWGCLGRAGPEKGLARAYSRLVACSQEWASGLLPSTGGFSKFTVWLPEGRIKEPWNTPKGLPRLSPEGPLERHLSPRSLSPPRSGRLPSGGAMVTESVAAARPVLLLPSRCCAGAREHRSQRKHRKSLWGQSGFPN